jgi:hypothetical protein
VECKDKIQHHERLVEDLIAVEGKRNDLNAEQMPQLRSTEQSDKVNSFSDSGKQLDCSNSCLHKSLV